MQVPLRTGLGSPPLIRLLARLAALDVAGSRQSLPDKLGQWLGWTDAVALSSALTAKPPAALPREDGDEARECERVRAALVKAISDEGPALKAGHTAPPLRLPRGVKLAPVDDYADYRQRCLFLQRAMDTALGNLRSRLRAALAAHSPDAGRLAVLDTVMERVLGAREASLLALVPTLLERRFRQLRQTEQAVLAEAQADGQPGPMQSDAWQATFRREMREVLLAELDLRFLPVEGLLAALQDR